MCLRTVVRRFLAAGFVLVVVLGTHAGFAAAETVVFDSGLVGAVGGQKVRINVVDVGSADREGSCAIELSLLNDAGQVVGRAQRDVDPSHAASFEHTPAPDRGGLIPRIGRLLIRGRVTTTGEPCAGAALVPTLEVLDADGKTVVLQSPGGRGAVGPVLATSAVFRAGTGLWCFVANVNQSKTVEVDVEAVDDNGGSAVLVTQTIAARAISGTRSEPTGRVAGYCRFVLRSGSKEDVRASYCVEGETGLDCVVTGDAR